MARGVRSSARLAAVAVAVALALAGCAVGAQDDAEWIDPSDVPFGLTLAEPRRAQDGEPGPETATFSVFLVGPGGLTEVRRRASVSTDAQDVVDTLLEGPTDQEAATGLRSALPPRTRADVSAESSDATVDLSGSFLEAARAEQALAIGQLVYTLTAVPGITRVRFLLDGEPLDIPRADGTVTREPVSRSEVQVPPAAS